MRSRLRGSPERLGGEEATALARELDRQLGEALEALQKAHAELRSGEQRQAYGKLFLAWKKAVAALLAAAALAAPEIIEALEKAPQPPLTERWEIIVTTGNAPKLLRLLRDSCLAAGCPMEILEAARLLEEARRDAYMLHYAYYEGPERAGFADDGEAMEAAERTEQRIREALKLLGWGPRR